MTYPPNSTPGAADSVWATPARPPGPVVTPSPMTREVPETPDPIVSPGGASAKTDDVAASVAEAVANAQARFTAHELDTHAQSSQIGVLVDLPEVPCEHSKHAGGDGAGYPS